MADEAKPGEAPDSIFNDVKLPVTRDNIVVAQEADVTQRKCFSSVVPVEIAGERKSAYYMDNGLLMRKWCRNVSDDFEWSTVNQIVVPVSYRQAVLALAHGHALSGHLGIKKTNNQILKHFVWPRLKSDVKKYCRTCQFAGKPNQVIPHAPLVPIPVMGEPFEHVIIECVDPLPKTRIGNQYLLTIMCAATHFPEAIPLQKITAPVITRNYPAAISPCSPRLVAH